MKNTNVITSYQPKEDATAKIKTITQSSDNSIEIKLDDGRELRLIVNGHYNPNKIRVIYHSHEWAWEDCGFDNFFYPED